MKRFRVLPARAAQHCGHRAVAEALGDLLSKTGVVVGPKDEFDTLIVIGLSAMQGGCSDFLLAMNEIRIAQHGGKETYLVNSVWSDNPSGYDDCLSGLTGLWVCDAKSATQLGQHIDREVPIHLDLSYFSKVDPGATGPDVGGAVCVTDIATGASDHCWLPDTAIGDWRTVDMTAHSWSALVNGLSTARLLVTGRYHGMIAACKAQIPFVPLAGDPTTYRGFLDFLKLSGSDIPVARSLSEARHLVRWALGNPGGYKQLFQWMGRQQPWDLSVASNSSAMTRESVPGRTLVQRANAAVFRRNYAEALPLWTELLAEKGEKLPYPRNASMAFFGAGDVDTGMTVLTRARLSKPASIIFAKMLMQFARHTSIWLQRGGDGWWAVAKDAAYQAQVGNDDGFWTLCAEINERPDIQGNAALHTGVMFFLSCKLVQLNKHDLAFELRRRFPVDAAPGWLRDQEVVLLNSLCRRFDADAIAMLDRMKSHPSWADPTLRVIASRYETMLKGATGDLAAQARENHEKFPKHVELRELVHSICGEAGQLGEALPSNKVQADLAGLERDAERSLPLARYLVSGGFSKSANLQSRAALMDAFEQGQQDLMELLADKDLQIAVVGNSPVETGRGRGREIDRHDVVIRFNDFAVEPPYDRDYGRKTDIVFQTYPLAMPTKKLKVQDHLLVQRHAFNVYEPRDWEPVLQLVAEGQRVASFPRSAFIAAAELLKASPSAGFVLALQLKLLRGEIDRRHFFGFSFTDQLDGQNKAHYFNNEKPSLIHDWQREAEEFEKLFG